MVALDEPLGEVGDIALDTAPVVKRASYLEDLHPRCSSSHSRLFLTIPEAQSCPPGYRISRLFPGRASWIDSTTGGRQAGSFSPSATWVGTAHFVARLRVSK